jgi:hypothetical protein
MIEHRFSEAIDCWGKCLLILVLELLLILEEVFYLGLEVFLELLEQIYFNFSKRQLIFQNESEQSIDHLDLVMLVCDEELKRSHH